MLKWKTFTGVDGRFYNPNQWTIARHGEDVAILDGTTLIADPLFVEGLSDDAVIEAAIFECKTGCPHSGFYYVE